MRGASCFGKKHWLFRTARGDYSIYPYTIDGCSAPSILARDPVAPTQRHPCTFQVDLRQADSNNDDRERKYRMPNNTLCSQSGSENPRNPPNLYHHLYSASANVTTSVPLPCPPMVGISRHHHCSTFPHLSTLLTISLLSRGLRWSVSFPLN